MSEPARTEEIAVEGKRTNWTLIALIGGLLIFVLVIAYFASNRSAGQDKLTEVNRSASTKTSEPEKLCASKSTYDLIKSELFRRAAQLRGTDQAAFDKLAGFAVIRVENPVMESQDEKSSAINCSGSISIDLPPGVGVAGGRHTLTSDVDYVIQQAADGTGPVVLLRNADAITSPLATLARAGQPTPPVADGHVMQDEMVAPDQEAPAPPPSVGLTAQPRAVGARPSFDCTNVRSKGEAMVCNDPGLAALDRNMTVQFARSMQIASPEQQVLLRSTGERFISYRDRCPNASCIGDAYAGRMREIRDIMEGRWQPPR